MGGKQKKQNRNQKGKQQSKKATKKPPEKAGKVVKSNLKKGAALRTRDEYLKGSVAKPEYADDKELFYRVVYTVAVNELNEAAVVKRTTKKGRHLKSNPKEKFREEIYIEDNEGNSIKIGEKFIRSMQDDIAQIDVDYILKRCSFYPDTAEKLRKFKMRGKKNPPK